MFKKFFAGFLICVLLLLNNGILIAQETKYPDWSYEFLGEDKFENFNRKVFNFNLLLNKYAIRPIHIIWSSIMPEYGMDRIQGITNNIEYPIRLVSSLLQRDFKTSKDETIRFFTNTILGIGGMFDPAKHIFKIEQSKENMEQALAKCHVKQGSYFVLPILSFTNLRAILGKVLDCALNPSSYVGSPLLAAIKAGLTINRTAYLQPLIALVEANYADPYEIAKKFFGLDSYIKCENLDRMNLLSSLYVPTDDVNPKQQEYDVKKTTPEKKTETKKDEIVKIEVSSEIVIPDLLYGGTNLDNIINNPHSAEEFKLVPDIVLKNYNPQSPVIDSMRTALFSVPEADKSMWNELSVWNRSFSKQIKTSSLNIVSGKDNYKFRYILHKETNGKSPLVIIYPSIGEGITSTHSVFLAKIFYDAGYSVVIQGSHFQWEFVKSMPDNYHPGLPAEDAKALRELTGKIISQIESKHNRNFEDKIIIGTSFGALTSLFVAAEESKNPTLGNTKFISICPPVNLIYAMKQVDKTTQDWNNSSEDLKNRVALTAAKVVNLLDSKEDINFEINNLPFNDYEGKLITGFIMHQKLSDVIFTIEKAPKNTQSDIYHRINNMNYQDYVEKYFLTKNDESCDDLSYETSLNSISEYLEHNNNYKIYHSMNDYLTNQYQLKQLKQFAKDNLVLLDNGAHLGFLYRKEFQDDLKQTIALY